MSTPIHRAVSSAQRFLLVKEAAAVLGVSAMTLYRMIREQQFPAVRIRTRWIVPAEAVRELAATPIAANVPLGPGLVDVPLVARVLRVSSATMYRLIQDGGFPSVCLRGRVLVPSQVVDEMAAAAMAIRAAIDPSEWVNAAGHADRGPIAAAASPLPTAVAGPRWPAP